MHVESKEERDRHRKEIGARIATARLSNSMTQRSLADALRVTSDTVSRLENGKHGASAEVMVAIARKCGVSVGWLLTGEDSGPDETEAA